MTATSIQDPTGPGEAATTDQAIGSVGRFLTFALEYWRGDQRRSAWLLTGSVLAIMAVLTNFTAIQRIYQVYWKIQAGEQARALRVAPKDKQPA